MQPWRGPAKDAARVSTAPQTRAAGRIAARLCAGLLMPLLAGCAMLGPAFSGAAHPLAQVQRFGLVFVGDPAVEPPARLRPGPAGDAAVQTQGLVAGLLWLPGWLTGGPLWVPLAHAAGEAACRDAVNADPGRSVALRRRLADWPAVAQLNRRLAERLAGRTDRLALGPDPHADAAALVADAASKGLDAVAIFDVKRVELRTDTHGACSVQFFVAGRIRAVRVPDGALLEIRPAQPDLCRGNAAIPLAHLLRDENLLQAARDAAIDCAARELIEWADQAWSRY